MRSTIVGLLLGLGLLAATAAPSLACTFSDQAAADSQQKTAQNETQQPPATSTQ